MDMLLSCAIGVIIGVLISYFIRRHYTIGNLRIDNSDINDSSYLFLEMNSSNGGVEWISKQKYIVLKVLVKDYITHK